MTVQRKTKAISQLWSYISRGDASIPMESELCALRLLLQNVNLPAQIPPDHLIWLCHGQ